MGTVAPPLRPILQGPTFEHCRPNLTWSTRSTLKISSAGLQEEIFPKGLKYRTWISPGAPREDSREHTYIKKKITMEEGAEESTHRHVTRLTITAIHHSTLKPS
jgi:hypothetical protein